MLVNVDDYRTRARAILPRFVFDYVDGGAGCEAGLARNRAALEQVCLVPRPLRDVRAIDLSVDLFGQRWSAPLAVAPIGLAGLVRPHGDLMLAGAAARAGLPYLLSTASNARLETVRRQTSGAAPWLQLYVMGERSIAEQIVRRARQAGYGALVLTVDVPVGGNRERDRRNRFGVPLRIRPALVFDVLRRPGWLLRLARAGAPTFANLAEDEDTAASPEAQAILLSRAMDRSLAWHDLAWLRRLWDGPLLLKGLLHPDDARLALRHGVDGIIVSNHGGRQFDAAPATITMLPRMLDAIGARMPVLVDSGFSRGVDIARALALGAAAVLVGRAPVWGLACGGEAGAHAVLQMLLGELEHAMTLLGASQVAQLAGMHLPAGPAPAPYPRVGEHEPECSDG